MHANLGSDVDLDELDALVSDELITGQRTADARGHWPASVGRKQSSAAAAERQANPSSTVSWRSVRNSAPLIIGDIVSLAASGLLAQTIVWLAASRGVGHWGLAGLGMLPVLFAYWLGGLYSGIGVHPVVELRQILQFNTIALGAAAIGALFVPLMPIWCVAAWLISIVLVPLTRGMIRSWCARQSWWGHPILMIGSGQQAPAAIDVLLRTPSSGLRPILFTDPSGGCQSCAVPVENDAASVEKIIIQEAIRYAVVWLPDLPYGQLPEVMDRYNQLIPHMLIASDSSAFPSLWGTSRNCGQLAGMELRNGQMLAPLRFVKRSVDLTIATISLLLGSPILLAIALLVKLGSSGPVFYGHTRIGVKGRGFSAWKFRTMYNDGDHLFHTHLQSDPDALAEWQRDQKLREDPRVTPIGRFLRKWSLDELPQIWNVLKGDMSIVGPRPIVKAEAARYGDTFRLYASVKPGITGLWQVSGRNDTTYDERVRMDAYYIRNWSPWFDLYILIKTLVVLICRTGAY